jgi:hypothetical protein
MLVGHFDMQVSGDFKIISAFICGSVSIKDPPVDKGLMYLL